MGRDVHDDPLRLLEERNQVRRAPEGIDRARDAELRGQVAEAFAPRHMRLRTLTSADPPSVLDQVVEHDSVHPIRREKDLLRRVAGDRRILALEHEAIPDRLLVFVEVALCDGLDVDMPTILDGAVSDPAGADTAIFYSINRCEPGLAGLDVPAELLRRAVPALQAEHASLEVFSTLSPIPSLRRHVREARPDLAEVLDDSWQSAPQDIREELLGVATQLVGPRAGDRVPDPVARFHLGNGARLVALRWGADPSPRGVDRSWALMANYQYAP